MDTVNKLSNIITVPSSIRSEPTRYPLDLLPVIANKVLHPLSQPPSAGRLSDLVLPLHPAPASRLLQAGRAAVSRGQIMKRRHRSVVFGASSSWFSRLVSGVNWQMEYQHQVQYQTSSLWRFWQHRTLVGSIRSTRWCRQHQTHPL